MNEPRRPPWPRKWPTIWTGGLGYRYLDLPRIVHLRARPRGFFACAGPSRSVADTVRVCSLPREHRNIKCLNDHQAP